MGYLIFQILFFLLLAAALGFVIGWLLRGARFQTELQDLDARWRSKLGEVEGERDRFAADVTQANDARATFETSAAEARKLADSHEASLNQLRQEHEARLGAVSEMEKKVGSLEKDLADRDKALASAKQQGDGDSGRLVKELAAATGRAESLERDLRQAKEANGACKQNVERLEARIAEMERAGSSAGGGALGLMGSPGSSSGEAAGSAGGGGGTSSSGSRPLGLVGGTDTAPSGGADSDGGSGAAAGPGGSGSAGGRNEPGYTQKAASPAYLADAGGQGFTGSAGGGDATSGSGASSGQGKAGGSGGDAGEGVRPQGLSEAEGGKADDLKKISGVGPKLEKTLNGLGIFHFHQIAAFNPDNVAWVDRHLRFKGRIARENWIEQAKILASGGETEFSRRK